MTSQFTNKTTSFSSQNLSKNATIFHSDSSGKEKDSETGYHYFGARYYNSDLSLWLSVDPMSDKYPSLSPYNYCAWNPIKLVDPDGRKDRPFKLGDKQIFQIPGTKTPIIGHPSGIGRSMVYSAYSMLNSYNCHSYAWHNSLGDKYPAPGDVPVDDFGVTSLPRWDNNPADDIRDVLSQGGRQLGSDENNIVGDRVIYYTDQNSNGKYDDGESISHSAIVTTVDKDGYTTLVIGKMGQGGVSENHPAAPGYYQIAYDEKTKRNERQSRAYFRMPTDN